MSDYHEAEVIAQLVKAQRKKHKDHTIALLYRTHFQSRNLEEGLIKNSIPYKIIGGVQFYERKEIKDLLAYLRLIINPFDRSSFRRIINTPTRGLGEKFEEQFNEVWANEPFLTFTDVAHKLLESGELPKVMKETVIAFIKIFADVNQKMLPSQAVAHIVSATQYRAYLKEEYDQEESLSRLDNIKELINAMLHFEEQGTNTIAQLLDEIALMQEHYKSNESEQVKPVLLMTLHAAKGLEFDLVVIPGFEEGLLPSTRSLSDEDAIEEERRLLYVGITRAREYLLITHSRYRYTFGTMNDQRPSRFLREIPTHLQYLQDASHWRADQLTTFFNEWLGNVRIQQATATPVYTAASFTPASTVGQKLWKSSPTGTSTNTEPHVDATTAKQSAFAKVTVGQTAAHAVWKKNQPVKHANFGIGIIKDIEMKGADTIYLTISFKTGTKKISYAFVSTI
jgi:DNA helicase-2/ATP-dependent DNA helicase PcrA